MQPKKLFRIVLSLIAVLAFLTPSIAASAHGSTQVGDYELEIGFRNEPALQGVLNGLELMVMNTKTNTPVDGLEETLQVEIIFGASKKAVNLRPVFGEEGAYTAPIIPTEAGDYTWRIFGTIENIPVDVSMTSSPTTFASVEPQSSVSFPGSDLAVSDLQAELQSARQMALIALIVGVVGVLVGIAGLVAAFTRTRRAG